MRTLIIAVCIVGCSPCADEEPVAAPSPEPPVLQHEVSDLIVGDLQAESLLVWACGAGAWLHIEVGSQSASAPLSADHDGCATVGIEGLEPSHTYPVRAWSTDERRRGPPTRPLRSIETPPARTQPASVRFGFGGDVAGQNVCRHAEEGFPIFEAIRRRPLDFFIGLGDMIYADDLCEATGRYGQAQVVGNFDRATSAGMFWAHWHYARQDPSLRAVLERFPYVAVWDDHEVINDFDSTSPALPVGLRTFRDQNPLPEQLHRVLRWGKHLQLIVLDARQHRAAKADADDQQEPKSMLGPQQRQWLTQALSEDVTWHVVVSSVPISIPTGWPADEGRDGWADYEQDSGYERELQRILEAARENQASMIWITTDVHFASVFRYRPFDDDYVFHEVVTGPLNAGVFANELMDETFHPERLFWHGPIREEGRGGDARTWEEAKGIFNFGEISIEASGQMNISVRGLEGAPLWETTLEPQ